MLGRDSGIPSRGMSHSLEGIRSFPSEESELPGRESGAGLWDAVKPMPSSGGGGVGGRGYPLYDPSFGRILSGRGRLGGRGFCGFAGRAILVLVLNM
jgi:hypothetical protein